MDPNTTLRLIAAAMVEAKELAEHQEAGTPKWFLIMADVMAGIDTRLHDLHEWIGNGGYEPEWGRHPQAKALYRKWAPPPHTRPAVEALPCPACEANGETRSLDGSATECFKCDGTGAV